jgi:hypothetical protein
MTKRRFHYLAMLALAFFGSVLIALGIVKKLGDIDVLPAVTKYDQSGWLLIGLGFLLTLPFLRDIKAKVREKTLQNTTQ